MIYIFILIAIILVVAIWQVAKKRTRFCLVRDLLLRVQAEGLNNVDYVVFKQMLLSLDCLTSRKSKRYIKLICADQKVDGLTAYQAIMLQSLDTNDAGTLFQVVY